MVNKEWLIKLNDADNVWYDSDEKVYRRRMYCPICGKVSGCQCYEECEDALTDDINYSCSSKCALSGGEWDELGEAMSTAGMRRKISELTEIESAKCIHEWLSDKDTRYDVLDAINLLKIRKSTDELEHVDRIKILKSFEEEEIYELCDSVDIDMEKEVKDLTEEEAKKVIDILVDCDDYDYDAPMGEVCKM